MKSSIAALVLGLAVACLASTARTAHAQRPLSPRIVRVVAQAEALLVRGQNERAIRTVHPALTALTWSEGGSAAFDADRMLERAQLVAYSAVIRLRGRRTAGGARAEDPRATMVHAEEFLRALARNGDPLRVARHSEALVALGDRMPEAFGILAGLHTQGRLTEAEGYAALVLSARATGHADVAQTASERCAALARSRARRVCPR